MSKGVKKGQIFILKEAKNTRIFLDGEECLASEIDLGELSLGEHRMRIEAIDQAANVGESEITFVIIAETSGFTKILADLEAINEAGEIKKQPYLLTKFQLVRLQSWYKKMEFEKKAWRKKILANYIKFNLRLLDRQFDIYFKKQWLSADGYELLKKDLKYLSNML